MTTRSLDLKTHSLEVILQGQTPEGAYLAGPSFPTYHYSWFRDGTFIAEAADEWGERSSAAAFHAWAICVLAKQLATIELQAGRALAATDILHTRYKPDGTPGSEAWPNFQLDGFGTWLWAYRRHLERTSRVLGPEAENVIRRLADYLSVLWAEPNFDCWEEHSDKLHPSTLGALFAGLTAAASLLGDRYYLGVAESVRAYLPTHGVHNGHLVKHVGSEEVDANLLWLILPYEVVPVMHPIAQATLEKIRQNLLDPDGGLHRYRRDTYYGGGSWILLTADLAQVHLARSERKEVERLLGWIEAQATPESHLPEQVVHYLNDPSYLPEWETRWGKSACPLLWSHAAYLRLLKNLERSEDT